MSPQSFWVNATIHLAAQKEALINRNSEGSKPTDLCTDKLLQGTHCKRNMAISPANMHRACKGELFFQISSSSMLKPSSKTGRLFYETKTGKFLPQSRKERSCYAPTSESRLPKVLHNNAVLEKSLCIHEIHLAAKSFIYLFPIRGGNQRS